MIQDNYIQVPAVTGAPQERNSAAGAAIVCVSTANAIRPDDAREVVTSPFEPVEIVLNPTGPDVLETVADLHAVAESFAQSLDRIADLRRGVDVVHLFAAVPVGLAFRLGQRINPTKHPDVQTYQSRNESFWEHQGEASIVWGRGSTPWRCKRVP